MNANSKPLAPATINQWVVEATASLKNAGITSARLDAELIAAHVLGVDRTWLIAHGNEPFHEQEQANELTQRRAQREPLAYLTSHKDFYGRQYLVTRDTLIPRPETETIIELAKKYAVKGKVLDVGTGSGCIGITLALENGVKLYASDLFEDTLEVAMTNAADHKVKGIFAVSHLLNRWEGYVFDTIVANLPYVDESWERSPETDYEPQRALFADDNGLRLIKELITAAPTHLNPNGYLFLEADPEQHACIIKTGALHGLRHVETDDYIVVLRR